MSGLTYSGHATVGSMGSFHLNGLRTRDISYVEDGQLATLGDGATVRTICASSTALAYSLDARAC